MHPNKGEQRKEKGEQHKEKYGLTNWKMRPRGDGNDLFAYLFWIVVVVVYGLGFWLISKDWVGIALLAGGVAFTYVGIYGDD